MVDTNNDTAARGSDALLPAASRVAVMTVTVIAVVAVAWLLVELSGLLMLVFASLVLATVFDAMTRRICRLLGAPRGLALALSVLAFLGVFAAAFFLFGAQLAREFDTIRSALPSAFEKILAFVERLGLGEPVRKLLDQGGGDVSQVVSRAGDYVLTAGNVLTNAVLVLVGAIFIAGDPSIYRRGLLLLMPRRAERTMAAALDDAGSGLRGWMFGQLISSMVVAALTWGGLAALGVPAAGGLGVIAGLLDVIPMVGPIISGVPAVLLAFTVSPASALWTIGLFLAVQQLQGNFLQPMIQKQAVDVPPALLLFAVVAAGTLFGFLGVLLAAPLTVVSFVFVQRIYVRTLLGKKIDVAG